MDTDLITTTGSFQNQTTSSLVTPATRKRSQSALRDASNVQSSKRRCSEAANKKISSWTAKRAPRGNSKAALASRWAKKAQNTNTKEICGESIDHDHVSLQHILLHDQSTFCNGKKSIESYIERNTGIEMLKGIAIMVFSTAVSSWGMGILEAAQKAAEVTGVSVHSVCKWAAMYFECMIGTAAEEMDDTAVEILLSSDQGKGVTNPLSLIHDEQFRLQAREYVRANSCQRGEPNLTADMFQKWVKEQFECEISTETARLWLRSLGFAQKYHKKGVYFDGHERQDVVEYRAQFVQQLNELDRRCIYDGHEPQLMEGEKPLVQIHHDESTFYANADQGHYWADDHVAILKQKSLGQAIMVSDFVEEATGNYLRHDGKEARLLLETQQDGYFDSEKFLAQVDNAVNIFEEKFPHAQALFCLIMHQFIARGVTMHSAYNI